MSKVLILIFFTSKFLITMGLFSFLKNVGSGIFKNNSKKVEEAADAAEAKAFKESLLVSAVESSGIEVENLSIELNDDTAVIYGQTGSIEDKEKVILIVGNTEGIATVDDRLSVVAKPTAKFYEVQSGDSLSKIAKEFYGDPMRYNEIFEANKPMLKDPNLIYPGQMLRIPNAG